MNQLSLTPRRTPTDGCFDIFCKGGPHDGTTMANVTHKEAWSLFNRRCLYVKTEAITEYGAEVWEYQTPKESE